MKVGIKQYKIADDLVLTASTDGYVDISNAFQVLNLVAPPVIFIKAVEDTNGSTLDVSIEVSLDGGTNKEVAVSMTQLSAPHMIAEYGVS